MCGGRKAADSGEEPHGAAEARFAGVAAGLCLADPISGGLLDLERAAALLGLGRWKAAAERAESALSLFRGLRIAREALAAAITAAEAILPGQRRAMAAVIAARRRLGA